MTGCHRLVRGLLVGRLGADRTALDRVAVFEDVGAKAAAVDEWSEESRALEPFEMGHGSAKRSPRPATSPIKVAANECVDVDAAGEHVAASAGDVVRASRVVSSSTTSAAIRVSSLPGPCAPRGLTVPDPLA